MTHGYCLVVAADSHSRMKVAPTVIRTESEKGGEVDLYSRCKLYSPPRLFLSSFNLTLFFEIQRVSWIGSCHPLKTCGIIGLPYLSAFKDAYTYQLSYFLKWYKSSFQVMIVILITSIDNIHVGFLALWLSSFSLVSQLMYGQGLSPIVLFHAASDLSIVCISAVIVTGYLSSGQNICLKYYTVQKLQ